MPYCEAKFYKLRRIARKMDLDIECLEFEEEEETRKKRDIFEAEELYEDEEADEEDLFRAKREAKKGKGKGGRRDGPKCLKWAQVPAEVFEEVPRTTGYFSGKCVKCPTADEE